MKMSPKELKITPCYSYDLSPILHHPSLQLHLSNNNRKPKPSVRLVAETVIIKGQEIDATKTAETSLEMNKKRK